MRDNEQASVATDQNRKKDIYSHYSGDEAFNTYSSMNITIYTSMFSWFVNKII